MVQKNILIKLLLLYIDCHPLQSGAWGVWAAHWKHLVGLSLAFQQFFSVLIFC